MRILLLAGIMICFGMMVSCKKCAQSKEPMIQENYRNMITGLFNRSQDLSSLFPRSEDEIHHYADACMRLARQELDEILSINSVERNFDNTVRALDHSQALFSRMVSMMHALSMVSPNQKIREASHHSAVKLNQFAVDTYLDPLLYKAFQDYLEYQGKGESLNDEQHYFLQETMRDFKREGLNLAPKELAEVKQLKKEISQLSLDFEKNVARDKSVIKVDLKDLQGIDEHLIKNLARDGEKYILSCDYPTYFEVMDNCQIRQTRKNLYFAFNNRAYPDNVQLLHTIIAKRDELAKKLGFESFAALNIDAEMAKTPERSEAFLFDLLQKTRKKVDQEFDLLKNNLPDGIDLDAQGKMYPWDYLYLKAAYKKKYFNIDERVLAEYFPAQKALEGMFAIYQDFLGLEFKEIIPDWTWHDEVKLIQIYDKKTQALRGYLFLDLYPRNDKYSHACYVPLILPQMRKNSVTGSFETIPSVGIVIANFPRSSKERPALLKHSDVETFFHEFGHAMHGCLGKTEMASLSGTSVKADFVEMPSQMFEEWMFDKKELRRVSSHYKTGESLPDELIEKKILLKRFDSGYFVQRQAWLALISLYIYKAGAQKDTDLIVRQLHEAYFTGISFHPETHFQASFGHLMGYGARYYSYMWSKVFALDIFEQIKEAGFSQAIGQKFVQTILGRGGSADPNVLLKDFLGREPKSDAFMKDLGLV